MISPIDSNTQVTQFLPAIRPIVGSFTTPSTGLVSTRLPAIPQLPPIVCTLPSIPSFIPITLPSFSFSDPVITGLTFTNPFKLSISNLIKIPSISFPNFYGGSLPCLGKRNPGNLF